MGEVEPIKTLRTLDEWKTLIVLRTLKRFNWNRTHTAKSLGIGIRTLRNIIYRIRKRGIDVPAYKAPERVRKEKPKTPKGVKLPMHEWKRIWSLRSK